MAFYTYTEGVVWVDNSKDFMGQGLHLFCKKVLH